jgi:hypothetical protein
MKTVETTTETLPKKRINVPTEFMAATIRMLLVKRLKAFWAALQKLYLQISSLKTVKFKVPKPKDKQIFKLPINSHFNVSISVEEFHAFFKAPKATLATFEYGSHNSGNWSAFFAQFLLDILHYHPYQLY